MSFKVDAIYQAKYERSIVQAVREGVRITDDYGDGLARVWKVMGSKGLASEDYTVRYVNPWLLSCNCNAGVHGQYCKHRAVVHHRLLGEWARETATAR